MVAHGAAEDLVHGQLERFALDVPERQVHRAHGVSLLTPRRVEPRDVHLLPDRLDLERVLADERARALLQRVLRPAFTDPRDPHVGLDRADHVALIEEGIGIRRLVDPDPRDLAAGELSLSGLGAPKQKGGRRSQGLEQRSSVHGARGYDSRQSAVDSRQSQSAVAVVSPSRKPCYWRVKLTVTVMKTGTSRPSTLVGVNCQPETARTAA